MTFGTPGVNIEEASGLTQTTQPHMRRGELVNLRDKCDGSDDSDDAPFPALGPIHRVGRIVRAVPRHNIRIPVRVRG